MDLQIELKQSDEIQRFLCVLNLGMLDSLHEGAVTFEDAYAYFYRPYLTQLLQLNNANKEIIELFEECCLLEDIQDIAPDKLLNAIKQRKKETLALLISLPSKEKKKYWFNKFDE